jgi:4-oxalocrotonate tautomerase
MIVVLVEWLAGRTPEQKEELVAGITDILGRGGGAQRENVQVVLHDVPPSNWGRRTRRAIAKGSPGGAYRRHDYRGRSSER